MTVGATVNFICTAKSKVGAFAAYNTGHVGIFLVCFIDDPQIAFKWMKVESNLHTGVIWFAFSLK